MFSAARPYFFSALFHGAVVGILLGTSSLSHFVEPTSIEVLTIHQAVASLSNPKIAKSEDIKKIPVQEKLQPENSPDRAISTEQLRENAPIQPVSGSNNLPDPVDGTVVTEGLKPLNLETVNKTIKRTRQAIEKNVEGNIKLKLLVDEHGKVRRVTALNNLGFGLDQVAEEAAWKLLFVPARIESRRVALETLYTVKFKIDHQ